MIQQFLIDGVAYNVSVLSLERSFEIAEETQERKTLSGDVFRSPLGTYFHYTMEVAERGGDRNSFDAFWDAMAKPTESHLCTFPYNQQTLTQRMYVKGGKQKIRRLYESKAEWDVITISFYAKKPKVMA